MVISPVRSLRARYRAKHSEYTASNFYINSTGNFVLFLQNEELRAQFSQSSR